MDSQIRIRQEAQETQDILADLLRWQPEANKRAGPEVSAKRSAGPALPGRHAGIAPLRGQRGNDTRKQAETPDAPFTIRESVQGASKVEQGTAASHTYDYFRTWDKFNYDAAIAEADGEETVRQAPANQAELQHQMSNQRTANAPVRKAKTQRDNADAAPEPSDAELWKDRGNKAFQKQAYAEAKKHYTQSIALDPTCLAYANRAMAELKLEAFSAAIVDCTEALALDASYIKAYLRRASAFKAMGKLLEAVEDYEHALRLDPTARDTANDRRLCLDLLYEQEHLQHELPRTALPSVAQVADQPKQKSVAQPAEPADPAEVTRQHPNQSASIQKPVPAASADAQKPVPAQSAINQKLAGSQSVSTQQPVPAQTARTQKSGAGQSVSTQQPVPAQSAKAQKSGAGQSNNTQKPAAAQSPSTQKPASALSADSQKHVAAQSADTQKHAHAQSTDAQKQPLPQQMQSGHHASRAFGGKGQPSCIIEEVPYEAEGDTLSTEPRTAAGGFVQGTASKAKLPSPWKAKQPNKPSAFSFGRPSKADGAQPSRTVPNAVQSSSLAEDPPASPPAAGPQPPFKAPPSLAPTLPDNSSQKQNGFHSHLFATQQSATQPSTPAASSAVPVTAQLQPPPSQPSPPVSAQAATAAAASTTAAASHARASPSNAPSSTAAAHSFSQKVSASQHPQSTAAASVSLSNADSHPRLVATSSTPNQAVPAESGSPGTQDVSTHCSETSASAGSVPQRQQNGHATAASTSSQAAASEPPQGAANRTSSAAAAPASTSAGLLDKAVGLQMAIPRSGTEFEVSWKRLKGNAQGQTAYLQLLEPKQLPGLFKQSLTPGALCGIATVALTLTSAQDDHFGVQLLENLKIVPRFDMIVLSLPRRDKTSLKQGFDTAVNAPDLDSMVVRRLEAVRKSYKV